MSGARGARQRTLRLVTPGGCPLCGGDRRMWLVAGISPWAGADTRNGVTHCPHCTDRAPAVFLPWRTDTPRGTA